MIQKVCLLAIQSRLVEFCSNTFLQLAIHSVDYEFTNVQPREEGAFGLNLNGRMMLMRSETLPDLVKLLQETFLST